MKIRVKLTESKLVAVQHGHTETLKFQATQDPVNEGFSNISAWATLDWVVSKKAAQGQHVLGGVYDIDITEVKVEEVK